MKFVKPIKLFCSWAPDEGGLGQLLASETKPDIRTAAARVLRKTDAAVGQELGRLEQLDGLLEHAIPGIAMRVLELLILIELPFLKQGRRRVLPQKVGGQSAFKGGSEEHGGPGVFLFPAIEITMAVAARADQILADL